MRKVVLIFYLTLLIISCKSKKEVSRDMIYNISSTLMGKNEYYNLLKMAQDSLDLNIKKNSNKYYYLKKTSKRDLDNILCINKEKTKVILVEFCIWLNSPFDDLNLIYGVKVKNKWYFIEGESVVIPRYNESSFENLKQQAMESIYKSYVFRNKNGDLEINDNFFSDFTSIAWKSKTGVRPWDKESWDQLYLDLIEENRLKIDTMDYSKLE
jgi:hypothetical protein